MNKINETSFEKSKKHDRYNNRKSFSVKKKNDIDIQFDSIGLDKPVSKNTSNNEKEVKVDKKNRAFNKSKKNYNNNNKVSLNNNSYKRDGVVLPQEDSLRIYPLGGQEEVGRNCTVFEYGEDIVILDMGLQFSDEDMPGVDYIVPNVSSLRGKEKNIRGVVFSHGHLDHIGAAPILLEQLNNPVIVGRKLTLSMIKHRQEDYKKGSSKN